MVHVTIFGRPFLLKKNPWTSGTLARKASEYKFRVKKDIILATPPPWFFDVSKLSDGQMAQVMKLSAIAKSLAGKKMSPADIAMKVKEQTKGVATGFPRKPRVRPAKISAVIAIARTRGIAIPPELAAAGAPPRATA